MPLPTAKKAEETESVLSQELVEAKETVARLEAENAKLRAQLDEASAGGDGAANEVIALREEVESLKAQLKAAKASGGGGGASEDELAQLREELEEERAQAKDYKQKLLELRAEHRKCAK
jgi:predicted RNase H-like nuclease (RuvC/YqgF family)